MAWIFWQPNKPTNLTGSLVSGGTMLANTTYYFRVFAWDTTSATRVTPNQANLQAYSPYSDTFSITTTTTEKSVNLVWDKVYKSNGITEVDGYEVMISLADDFDTAGDGLARYPSQVNYFNPATLTNSFTCTTSLSVGTGGFKNTKDGLLTMTWDGVGSGTNFKSLYDTLKAHPDYYIFARELSSFYNSSDVYAMQFMGSIVINKWSGDTAEGQYSFSSTGEIILINGGLTFNSNCKLNLVGNIISVNGQTHRNLALTSYATGSNIVENVFRGGTRNTGLKSYQSIASGNSSLTSFPVGTTISNNINQVAENSGDGVAEDSTFFSWPVYAKTASSSPTKIALRMDGRNAGLDFYVNQAISGKMKKVFYVDPVLYFYPGGFQWSYDITSNNSIICNRGGGLIDTILKYSDRQGWDISLNNGANMKNFQIYQGKTIRVIVKDKAGSPIQGARVSFNSNLGINLTKGNSATTISRATATILSDGNSYQLAETTVKHNDPYVIVAETQGLYGYNQLKPNTNYWFRGEKMKILERSATGEAWNTSYRRYTAERELDGTLSGWALNDTVSRGEVYWEALDYVETDASGFTWNSVIFRTAKFNTAGGTNFLSERVSAGTATLQDHSPITIQVSKEGKQTKTLSISQETAIATGTSPITLEVTLDDAKDVLLSLNGSAIVNLDPTNVQNESGYFVV